jgi:cytochrome c5
MKKNYRSTFYFILGCIFLTVIFFFLHLRSDSTSPSAHKVLTQDGIVYLGQGWGMSERQQLSFTTFGSRMINYSWFIAVENAHSETLFRDNKNMERFGFIAEPAHQYNPDGLPIGVAQEHDNKGDTWIGLTCSACHTGQLLVAGQLVRIDGGQGLINYTQFENELLDALKATLEQPEKWERFVSRLKQEQKNINDDLLKVKIIAHIKELEKRYAMNASDIPYGHGRLDAFGQIFNAVTVDALGIPENKRSPDAPTSFPVLWDASHLDVVQWNASAPNKEPGPLAQNATTALAVYGTIEVLGHAQTYPSSIQVENLGYIQREFYKLTSPKWPENLAGALNQTLKNKGEKIYQQVCLQCHSLVDSSDAKRQLVAVVVPAKEVGTDMRMVNNFSDGTVKTGELEGKHFALWFGEKFTDEATRLDIVMHITFGALLKHPWDSLCAFIEEYASNKTSTLKSDARYYKARPLNGVWSSAPYLHNGSVPTVYDLLLPAAQRPNRFFVGNRELDNVKLGNQITETENSSLFDADLIGNSNVGHEYGTQLLKSDRMALLEYIKSL